VVSILPAARCPRHQAPSLEKRIGLLDRSNQGDSRNLRRPDTPKQVRENQARMLVAMGERHQQQGRSTEAQQDWRRAEVVRVDLGEKGT
jgi:hypothetical protein